ncbi:flagellar biosynthesis protein FlhB [Desulfurivibrio dismutans]|uniref:flagellar biosynthesis protein FlhB n=1 Tax=Desulfurivibrio dismutans TaxID=1398908 RepID=UPI0023D9D399|nr:flagellar biosynthesis protein FlhB [Desulfurivibrio alkaliphilus]MDF1615209.1 flagellar biosynthesis protein FlhB [Desulfurivibrio alkaliphilus]
MAEEQSGQEKTEKPTERRLLEARKKGDVAKSMEVPSAAVLLAGVTVLYFTGERMFGQLTGMMQFYLGNLDTLNLSPGNMPAISRQALISIFDLLWPLMLTVFVVALLANYLQIGVLFTTEKITPKLEKIDPLKGLGRLFSKQALANFLKSMAKMGLVGYIAYSEVRSALNEILPLMDKAPYPIVMFMAETAFWIFLKCALAIVIIAAIDYAFQRWQFLEKMKMTKQDMKDEGKQTEGDPHVKGRIRAIQTEMARKRMMAEVPKADVVITNPTRLAIAIKYDALTMPAPKVLAKGAGVVAGKIREIAQENNIPIVEDKPLAQALHQSVEIDETIPENLFQAVAEVLAYVYNLRK